jgi:hypothetical protein
MIDAVRDAPHTGGVTPNPRALSLPVSTSRLKQQRFSTINRLSL